MEYKLYLNEIMQYNHLYTICMYVCTVKYNKI